MFNRLHRYLNAIQSSGNKCATFESTLGESMGHKSYTNRVLVRLRCNRHSTGPNLMLRFTGTHLMAQFECTRDKDMIGRPVWYIAVKYCVVDFMIYTRWVPVPRIAKTDTLV